MNAHIVVLCDHLSQCHHCNRALICISCHRIVECQVNILCFQVKRRGIEKEEKVNKLELNKAKPGMEDMKSETMKFKIESDRLREKQLKADTYSRRNNLCFEGVPIMPGNFCHVLK